MGGELEIVAADPRGREASALIAELSAEIAARYDFVDDGSGAFSVEDVLVPRAGFFIGWVGGVYGGEAVCCGAYRPFSAEEPGAAEVKRMYVRPAFRRRGYSAAMLAELERRAGLDGYRVMRLETAYRQPEAIGLYESRGYVRIENYGKYAGNIEHLCFEKRLAEVAASGPVGGGSAKSLGRFMLGGVKTIAIGALAELMMWVALIGLVLLIGWCHMRGR